ncbi:MAG: glutamate synthase subunit beta [Deltaproteobacteria bacterium]|jgi:glutamate synthase (NADPH/NADH) small chain|nr:glutamate synthase subunit beta [Deltaproteobacteria bacterium]
MSEYRPVAERVKDFNPVEIAPGALALEPELKRCQDCGVPFCHAMGCPLYNVIPEINVEALNGRYESAFARLVETAPFPEFTARVCPALCEGACVQGLNEAPVPARLVEWLVSEKGFAEGWLAPYVPPRRLDFSVAVVGSGPAGLAAAFYLNRAGARVRVWEKDAKPGGFLRYGIPDFKLDKGVIDRRIKLMEAEGVIFDANVAVGEDVSARLLGKRHDAVILAVGSRVKRDLPLPGRDLTGIFFATDYLSAQNRVIGGEIDALPPGLSAKGQEVIVVGGGDTGSDCVGTAFRQGARRVTQLEILPKPPRERAPDNPWPQWPRIARSSTSHEEGCERRFSVESLEFSPREDASGAVGALKIREVAWVSEGGRPRPVPVPGSEAVLPAQKILLALGFTGPDFGTLAPTGGGRPDKEGRFGPPGFYVAGDAATGPSLVVKAIADGLRVARTVLKDRAELALRASA